MSTSWAAVGSIGALGLAVGSFLNVVIYRVPRRESVMLPGSHCPECDEPIRPRHNVPVISWFVLGGRCRRCLCRISRRYPLVEGGTALLFAAVTLRFGVSIELPAYLYLAAVGMTLAMIDFSVRRVPDSIVLPSYVMGVLLLMPAGASSANWTTAGRAVAGMFALLLLYFALAFAYPNGLGFGDVKLAGLIGLYLGWMSWNAIFLAAVGGILIAGIAGIAGFGGQAAGATTRYAARSAAVPLGPCLVGAAGLALFAAAPIATWYGSLITV